MVDMGEHILAGEPLQQVKHQLRVPGAVQLHARCGSWSFHECLAEVLVHAAFPPCQVAASSRRHKKESAPPACVPSAAHHSQTLDVSGTSRCM